MVISIISQRTSLFPPEDVVLVLQFTIYLATGGLSSQAKLWIYALVSRRAFSCWVLSHVKPLPEYLKPAVSEATLRLGNKEEKFTVHLYL